RTLEALQSSEHRFHSLVETASDAIICADSSGHIVLWNRSAESMFGYSATEAVGQPVTLIMPERFHEAHRNGLKRFLETGKARVIGHTVEMSGRRRDGAEFPVELSLATWKSKEETFFAGIIRDISEHKQADEALQASEQRYRLLAENATDAIYRYRLVPSPGYEYMSPGITPIVGYTPEDFYEVADIDHKIVHADDRALLEEMRKTPASFVGPVMLRCIRKDGSIVWIEHHQTAIPDGEGRIVAIQAIARDVSERVRTMDEMEKLRSEFLGVVTHELKTPLAAIKGSAATALGSSRPLDPEDTRELFQIIDEQADRLRDLADNLLDMSRIEAGALAVKPEPVDLRSVLEEARTIFARGGRSQEVQIDLPQETAVNADKRRLVQVITNLLTNAAKFSPASRAIRVSVERDELQATVHVEDQGQGIRRDKLPLLFQKFSQVHDGSKTRTLGTGLGLAICKGIVEAHGGRIWADSAGEGKGATFSFTLPIASEPVAASPAAKPQAGAAVRRGERLRILAVDDELPVLRYLQHSLEEAGYQCLVTTDPSQVTTFVELEQPDLILLDLRLPGVSGFDLLKRIREFSGAPIIFLTASDSNEDTVRALKLGADDYVTKPFSPSELLARIEASLRRRSLPGMTEARPPFKLKDLSINFAERRVILGDQEISLSATEYKLLYELATHAGLVLTFDQILQRVWGAEYAGETELVRSFIRNLRRKLGDDAKQPSYILTERQIGYRMLKV
ncbi:MAG: PAS domain S-box protein, partial [Dehalococcoidia bacterium]